MAGNNQTITINTAHGRKMKNGGPVLVWGLGLHLFCNYEIHELKKDAPGKAGWWTFDSGGVSFDFFGFRMSGSLDYPVALECMSGNWLLVLCRYLEQVKQQTVMYKTVMEQVFAHAEVQGLGRHGMRWVGGHPEGGVDDPICI